MVGLQNKVAKKFAKILHLSVDPCRDHERFSKRYNTWGLGLQEDFIWWGCKIGLQNRVAKKFAKILHLSLDLSRGS